MKLNKYIKAAAVLLAAATALAGCKFNGTTTSFKGKEANSYKATEAVSEPGSIIDYESSINAEDKAEVYVTIASKAKLDEKSIENALNFYVLSDPADKNFAPVRGAVLPKTLRKIDVDKGTDAYGFDGDYILTTVYYYLDASSVTNDYVALVADATKLKEKTGVMVLNGNGNKKCGEESDSFVSYIGVTGTGITSLNWNGPAYYGENFAPTFGYAAITPEYELDADTHTYRTGVIIYDTSLLSTGRKEKADGTKVYATTEALKAALNNMYVFCTLPIGADKWTETPMSWELQDNGYAYKYKTAALEYGTKYYIKTKANNSLEWPEAKDFYGHTPRMSWNDNKDTIGTINTWGSLYTEPKYIINEPDNTVSSASTWIPKNDSVDFSTYQTGNTNGLLNYSKYSNYVQVSISMTYSNNPQLFRLNTYDGFVITDKNYNIVKTKAPVVYEKDDLGVISIIIELEDKNIDLTSGETYYFMVGEKTSLVENKSWPNQLYFGCPATYKTTGLPGYVSFSSF